jgi:hypothetical protein
VPGLERHGHGAGVTCEGTDSRCTQRADTRPVSAKLTDYWRALGSRTRAGRWHAGGTPQGGAAGTQGQATAHAESGGRETPAALAQARRWAETRSVTTGSGDLRRILRATTTRGTRQAGCNTHKCVWRQAHAGHRQARGQQGGFPYSRLTGQSALDEGGEHGALGGHLPAAKTTRAHTAHETGELENVLGT